MRVRLHTVAAAGRIDPPPHWRALHEYETHRVPFGATILDAKYCELCGRNFLRRAQSDDRYCFKCLLTILTVNPQIQKLASELIH